jgi:Methyltransferase domain
MAAGTPGEAGAGAAPLTGRSPTARVRRYGRAAQAVARDPVEGVERLREKLADRRQRRRGPVAAATETHWERSLHALIGRPWPCPTAAAFGPLWSDTMRSVGAHGVAVGRGAFGGWDDGDSGLARAAWCLTSHLEPLAVVETGVARGFTTRMVLQALADGGAGRLYSIDLPPPLERRRIDTEIAAAVPHRLRGWWTLVEGSSRRRLPGLLEQLGTIDLFIHDSRHTHRNISFELSLAWEALRPGGVLLADDVHCNTAFAECVSRFGAPPALVCPSDDHRGRFGLIQKPGPDRPPVAGPGPAPSAARPR